MRRGLIQIIMLLLIVQTVCADRIMILNMHYDKGELSLAGKTEQYGYYPDRKLQPETGYKAEIISDDNEMLYNFRFDVPLEHYTDIEVGGELQGGLVIVDEADFGLIIPNFPDAKEIKFYDENGEEKLVVGLKETELDVVIPAIAIVLVIISLTVYILIKRKKS